MIQIDKIEISYFRSIYKIKLTNIKDLVIFSGKNDCGKSNILKALNLFFNNETDWKTPLQFDKDFSNKRLSEVRKESIKGRQFIRVQIQFIRGNRSINTLPSKFTVSKTWYRTSTIPETKTSIERQFKNKEIKSKNLDRSQAFVQNYLNRIRYEYIPAIKDREFFNYSLGLLQDTILENNTSEAIKEAITYLNTNVEAGTVKLQNEFSEVSGVNANIKLPESLALLFRAFSINTTQGENIIPLKYRGDGIQTRFIASLLNYVSENSKLTYIWGFEEPENCLEYTLASDLAKAFQSAYSILNQIFLSTHSPAIFSLESENVFKARVFQENEETFAVEIYPKQDTDSLTSLHEELGLLEIQKKHQEELLTRDNKTKEINTKLKILETEILKNKKPIVLTEGKSDPKILEEAWKKLNQGKDLPYKIISCSTTGEECDETAGAGMLKAALNSIRPDESITIGIFDHDHEGNKEFNNLNRNFKEKNNIKFHTNGKCAAFCLPEVKGREEYYKVNNLPIEYYFADEYLIRKTSTGHGLIIKQEKAYKKIGTFETLTEDTTEPQYRKIVDGKVLFANEIVPNFPPEAFNNFKEIFSIIENITSDLYKNK
ncbi:MAG: AAA family ATPase [Spirochaetes bacterium]|nr:AAA family ATPase [Spirochaetota bacterium]